MNKAGSPAHINNGEITKKNSRSESSCCFIAILGNTGSLALHTCLDKIHLSND